MVSRKKRIVISFVERIAIKHYRDSSLKLLIQIKWDQRKLRPRSGRAEDRLGCPPNGRRQRQSLSCAPIARGNRTMSDSPVVRLEKDGDIGVIIVNYPPVN